jgi:N-acetylated-alpha-linked acidic dipeptidase
VFLNHLGRPVINLGFTGDYGVYHSMYDDHYWMSHIGDPTFEYHVALTRIWGVVALRLANADLLPFDFGFNAAALEQFLHELEQKSKGELKHLSLKHLHGRIAEFEKAGDLLRDAAARDLLSATTVAPEKIQRLNEQLLQVESNWLDPAGIPGRPWFQHLLYSSRYTYAHLEFPGLTEAVEKQDWKLAARQAGLLQKALKKNTELLRSARSSWEKTAK